MFAERRRMSAKGAGRFRKSNRNACVSDFTFRRVIFFGDKINSAQMRVIEQILETIDRCAGYVRFNK